VCRCASLQVPIIADIGNLVLGYIFFQGGLLFMAMSFACESSETASTTGSIVMSLNLEEHRSRVLVRKTPTPSHASPDVPLVHTSEASAAAAPRTADYRDVHDGGDGWVTEDEDDDDHGHATLSLNKSAYRVLQQIHPGLNIDSSATKLLVPMLQWTMTSIVSLTDPVLLNRDQLSGAADAASLFAALEKLLPGNLFKHAQSEVTKALIKAIGSNSNPSAWSGADAGLVFDPCAIVMHCAHHDLHVSRCVAVAVSAATEYISAEILELAGNVAITKANSSSMKENEESWKEVAIDSRGIKKAVRKDDELRQMFRPFWSSLSEAAEAVHPQFESASKTSAAAAPCSAGHGDDLHDGGDGWTTEDDDDDDDDGSVNDCDHDS
jgi:hypothetical protein